MTKFVKSKSQTGLGGNFEHKEKITLSLSEDDTVDLIDTLGFALETARFILQDAAANGKTDGTDKIRHYAVISEYLLRMTYNAIDLDDVPPKDQHH